MPVRDTAPVGAPCWIDLFTSDPDASHRFYGDLFGWKVDDPGPDYGGYVNFVLDGVRVAGCMRNDGAAGTPDSWSVYLAVTDAEAAVASAAEHGAQVVVPAMPVGPLGSMAVVVDPGGAVIGMWQPGEHTGFGVLAEPGSAGWFELHTRDYEVALDFYRAVFGWDTHVAADEPDFRYTTFGEGEAAMAGVMDATKVLGDGEPAHWSVYFQVADVDATIATAVELGATVVMPATDSPYGRLALLTDPTGAAFKLVG